MKRTISLWLRWVGVVLMVLVAGWASAQPVTPPLPSTAWSRGYMTNTTPAAARTYLGLAATNVAVTLLPYASQFETNGGVLALSATVSNQLAAGASAVQASDLPVASVDAAARQLLFTLPTDDPTMLGAIHPSCWYGSTNWNGYKYWLAYTTWPGVEREAIYLAVSHDGETWLPAPGTTDGRIGPNGADTEVQMLDDGSLCIYYLYAGVGGTTNNIDYLRSFDGTTWTTNRAFTVTNALAVGSAACPSIVREPDGTWRMWWHDKTFDGDGTDGDPYSIAQVYTLTSTTGTNWDITTAAACPGMTNGWHLDVARIGTNYYMLRCNEAVLSQGAPRAYTSPDGTNWTRLPGAGFQMPPGLLGPYRADIIPVNSWPPAFDVWWNSWDAYSATADATNSTSRVGRSRWIELPYAPLDWSKSNTLTMANTFFGSDSSASTVLPFAYPWSVAGVGALKMKYVANLGSGGLLYTNDSSGWGIFGLDAFGYKYDAAGSLGGGLFQSYETAPKSPSQFRVQWQIKLLTNSAAQIGLYKYGTFGSSVGSLTNIMVSWNTTGTNMAWLCVTNGSTSQRVAFDGVPSVAGTSHTANSALVEIEKTEWGKITARIYSYPNTYTATAAFADTTALWWTPFVAWKGTNGLERFDLRTKVNNARGASEFPSSAGMSVNAISMMTNGPVAATRFIGDGSALTNLPDGRSVDAGSVPVADRLAFAIGNGTYVRATVHPNAVWLPTNWNGAQIWLAFTGTTNQTETTFGTATEDPFIYASADGGNTWVLKSSAPLLSRAASCTLAGWSTNGWQADPEIYLDTNGVMRVIWMGFHTGPGGVTNAMFETSSTDGTTWSTPTLLKKWQSDVGNPWSTNATCAGPQIVTLPGGGLRLYYTDDGNYGTNAAGAATNTICYVSGLDSSGTNWDWGTVTRCALTPYLTNSVTPWHFDIALVSSNRWFLGYGSQASSFIEYATSTDGITWAPPGMGFLLPLKQKSEEYGYYKLTWAPVAGPNGLSWNVIANHTGTNQLLVNGWNFSLVRGLEPEPQNLTYLGANTNWTLTGGTKLYNGINRIGALTVVDDFKGTSSGKVGIGQPFNGWGGIAIGYNAPMDATNYTLASDGTSPRLNAKTGGTVNFAVNNSVVAGVNATAFSSTVPFTGDGGSLTNLNASALTSGTVAEERLPVNRTADLVLTNSLTIYPSASAVNQLRVFSTNSSTPAFIVTSNRAGFGTAAVDANFAITATGATVSGLLRASGTTDASGNDTGALRSSGGFSATKSIWAGGAITASNFVATATASTTPAFKSGVTNNMILKAPDGGTWILKVGNDGSLSTVTNTAGL